MADKKDFLEQFSNAGKPASFQEEERVEIKKEKKPINKVAIIIVSVVLLLILGVAYFIFLAPKIEMPNFVYQTKNDVVAWVKQQGIETTGIIFNEEYNFDYDEGVVLSQNIKDGTKVKENVKLTFLLSKGADPDELIKVPDIASMSRDEIKEWITKNKLTKTKINATYDDNVEEDYVIDFIFTGCDEDSFTRSSTLKINVSKGPQPAGKIKVEDFVDKPYANAEAWAKNNKVLINKTESYSDKIEKDYVISQSIDAGKTIDEGETLNIVVSLGKAVYAPNFVGMTRDEVYRWSSKNGVDVYYDEQYSNTSEGTIISQTIAEGSIVKEDIELVVSLGKPDFSGITTYADLKNKINEVNEKGAGISKTKTYRTSDSVPVGGLISTFGKVNVGSTLTVEVSQGKNLWLQDYIADTSVNPDDKDLLWSKVSEYNEDEIRKLCEYNNVTYEVTYEYSKIVPIHMVKYVTRDDDNPVKANTYISEAEVVNVVISLGKE